MKHWNRSRRYRARWCPGNQMAAEFVELCAALFVGTVCGIGGVPAVVFIPAWLIVIVDIQPAAHVALHRWGVLARRASKARARKDGATWQTAALLA